MKILVPILFITLSACGQNKTKILSEKHQIQMDSVESIYIKKTSSDDDSIKLTNEQVKLFVEKWNHSESVGLNKYLPEYWISLIAKDGSIRRFRTSSNRIKESNDLAFSIDDTTFFASLWKSKYSFPRPERYDPISFIEAVSQTIKANDRHFNVGIVMSDEFPTDWVKEEHLETLISMINSKDTCGCYLNPLSSYIPKSTDFSEKGGYAALFIKAFKDKTPVYLGLYACPKVDKKLNEEIISWWNK